MKNYKKITATFTTVALSFAIISGANAQTPFTDVKDSYEFTENLESMYYKKIMSGYKNIDGVVTIKPNLPVTRAQAAKMIAIGAGNIHATQNVSTFSDVPENYWAHDYITMLEQKNIVTGKGGAFSPNDQLTRAQIAKMLVLTFDLPYSDSDRETGFSDVDSASWEAPYIKALVNAGITTGAADGTFRPYDTVKRYQLAAFIDRIYENQTISDDQALVVVRGAYTKMTNIFYKNVAKTGHLEPVIPYEQFQDEMRETITENYEPKLIDSYLTQCRGCEWLKYDLSLNHKLLYKVIEKTEEKIVIQAAEPGTLLHSAASLGTVAVVKENGVWKVDYFLQIDEVPNFYLSKREAADVLETTLRLGEMNPVYDVVYIKSGLDSHVYNVKRQDGESLMYINRNTGVIADYPYDYPY